MSTSPLVSIIIPVYNSERFLKECFNSILSQYFKDFEVIIVDDGSTDSSLIIEEEYSKDLRFRVIKQENAGQGIARNRALDIAKGKYITFLDSDDAMKPDFLKETVSKIEGGKYDIVVTNYDFINEKSDFLNPILTGIESYKIKNYVNNCVFVNSIFNFKKKDGELLIYYFIFLGSFLGIVYIFLINSNINLIKLFF